MNRWNLDVHKLYAAELEARASRRRLVRELENTPQDEPRKRRREDLQEPN